MPGDDRWGNFWMWFFWRKPAPNIGEQTRRRVNVHLMPVLFCLYILAYLDRANLSWAKLDMTKTPADGGLGFTNEVIGFGAGVFFWSYWILEIPSTLSVLKRGARWVFVRILILWGIAATMMGFIGYEPVMKPLFSWVPQINNDLPILGAIANYFSQLHDNAAYQMYFFRFILGLFEGGFFPTVIFYLSIWYRQKDRARSIAIFMSAIPLSLVFGSIISGLIMKMDWFGLQGWRWVFIIQGVLPILAGIVTLFVLPNRPAEAKWLSNEERDWLSSEHEQEHALRQQHHGHKNIRSHIWPILALTVLYFSINISGYGLSTFMPSFFADLVQSDRDRELEKQLNLLIQPHFAEFKSQALSQSSERELKERDWATEFKHSEKYKSLAPQRSPLETELKQTEPKRKFWALLLTTLTYCIAFGGMLFNGWHSDRKQERILHVAVPLTIQSFCILMSGVFYGQPFVVIPLLVVGVGFTHYAHQATFWTIPTMFLGHATAAAAIGFINMIGNIGASVGQITVGKAGDTTFQNALFKIFWAPLIAAMIVLVMSKIVKQEKKSGS